eukprot:5687743-Pyramimonas_sp.AAC.1
MRALPSTQPRYSATCTMLDCSPLAAQVKSQLPIDGVQGDAHLAIVAAVALETILDFGFRS